MLPKFYPIVPEPALAGRLAGVGVKLTQLRMKDVAEDAIEPAVQEALRLCAPHGCTLVVNDYWRAAIACGAPYVHLGQEDLMDADVKALRRAGLKLGISTHSHDELERALAASPDYVALGPIYETTLKVMRFAPQGLQRIGEWKRLIGELPLVAIGGISLERAADVFAAGADCIAVVSDVVNHPEPERRAKDWLALAQTL